MCNKFEIGSIVEGTVTDIKPFGAFVALDENTRGLVHISQIGHSFTNDINEHVSIGDKVKVKIISIDEASKKISLSMKEAMPNPNAFKPNAFKPRESSPRDMSRNKPMAKPSNNKPTVCFEDKLKDWLKQADDRQAVLNKRTKRR